MLLKHIQVMVAEQHISLY